MRSLGVGELTSSGSGVAAAIYIDQSIGLNPNTSIIRLDTVSCVGELTSSGSGVAAADRVALGRCFIFIYLYRWIDREEALYDWIRSIVWVMKRSRSHTQEHNTNNTIQHTTRHEQRTHLEPEWGGGGGQGGALQVLYLCLSIYIDRSIEREYYTIGYGLFLRVGALGLHDIAVTKIVLCMAYEKKAGEGSYIAQKSCDRIAIV